MKQYDLKLPTKIYFGEGQLQNLKPICADLNMKKVLVVSDAMVSKLPLMEVVLGYVKEAGIEYDTWFDVPSDPDVDSIDALTARMKEYGADGAIAVGGGSPMDAAKAACILQTNEGKSEEYVFGGGKDIKKPGLPLVCIPTTAGTGSEVTGISVLSNHRTLKKASISHEYLKPAAAIVDPISIKDAPKGVTAATGMDALTHAIEAYVCKRANPVSDTFAEKAIVLVGENLVASYEDGSNLEARANMALASTFASVAMIHAGLGAVHGIAQSIGGVAGTAHGITNAVLLPHIMRLNYPGAPEKFDRINQLLGTTVEDLCQKLNIPKGTRDLGVTEDMFPKILEETMIYRQLPNNPLLVTEELADQMIRESF